MKRNGIYSDLGKICVVYNYIFNNILYDYEYPELDKKSRNIGFSNLRALEKRKIFRSQTLEGIFTKKTVCTGFSYIFKKNKNTKMKIYKCDNTYDRSKLKYIFKQIREI